MQPIVPNYAELNSSSGFKKRSLMRPASSAGLKDREFLRSIDASQNDTVLTTLIKGQLSTLQQDINQMDIDKKIRLGEAALEKAYVLSMKKWLREAQGNSERQEDEARVLKYLNVTDVSSGFKKLWKIVGLMDSMIMKSTELQLVMLLKYDDLFSSICKDYSPVTRKLNSVGQVFPTSTFLSSQIVVERMQDLFSLVAKMRKSSSGGTTGSSNAETDQIIAKLQSENAKLNSYLQKLTEELKNKPKQTVRNQSPAPDSTSVKLDKGLKVDKAVLDSVCSDISQRYKDQIEYLNKQVEQLLNEEARLKQDIKVLQDKNAILQDDLKEAGLKGIRQSQSQSYEAALQQQITHMKAGYDAKITRLMTDFATRERELKKKENEYRIEAEKVKFERSLLLKKYDLMK